MHAHLKKAAGVRWEEKRHNKRRAGSERWARIRGDAAFVRWV